MLALGGDPDAIPEGFLGGPEPAAKIDPDFEVMPECWPAVQVFIRCQNCWLVSPGGTRMCLIRTELAKVAEVMGFDVFQVMEDIYHIEATILETWIAEDRATEAKRKAAEARNRGMAGRGRGW